MKSALLSANWLRLWLICFLIASSIPLLVFLEDVSIAYSSPDSASVISIRPALGKISSFSDIRETPITSFLKLNARNGSIKDGVRKSDIKKIISERGALSCKKDKAAVMFVPAFIGRGSINALSILWN